MSVNKRARKQVRKVLLNHLGIALILLLLGLCPLVMGVAYGWFADVDRLEREGVVTQATVTAVEQFEEAASADPDSRAIDLVTLVDYVFSAENNQQVTGQYRSENLTEIPQVGSQFSIRYAESDPEFHEARVGAKQTNADAFNMMGGVMAFAAVAYALFAFAYAAFVWFKTWRRARRVRGA